VELRPGADAWNGLQQSVLVFEILIGIDELADLPVQHINLPIEGLQNQVDGLQSASVACGEPAVALVGAALHKLAAAGDQGVEFGLICRAFPRQAEFGALSELHQHAGVNSIGFGQDSNPDGKVTDAAWIDQGDRQIGIEQRVQERSFQAAGGFDDDAVGPGRLERLDDLLNARLVVGDNEQFPGIGSGQIELVLGNVNANEQ